jgi:hypothetical protein
MNVLLFLLAVFVVLIIAAYLIGRSLPESHTAARSAKFHGTSDTLFALIAGPQDWRVPCEPVSTLPGAPRRWREISHRRSILFEEVRSIPPREFQMRIADDTLPFGGSWTFNLSPEGDGTRLRITEEGRVRPPLFRFISRYIIGETRTIDTYLRGLAQKCGETIAIDP